MSQGATFLRLAGIEVKDLVAMREKYLYILPDNETVEWLIKDVLNTTEKVFAIIIREFKLLENCTFSHNEIHDDFAISLSGARFPANIRDGGFILNERNKLSHLADTNIYTSDVFLTLNDDQNAKIRKRV